MNIEVVEKFLPSFKNTKYNFDEGKDKIIKKIKEGLEKQNVKHLDQALYEIFIVENAGKHCNIK